MAPVGTALMLRASCACSVAQEVAHDFENGYCNGASSSAKARHTLRTANSHQELDRPLTSKPSVGSDIQSEPALAAWNGRFLSVAGGGNPGSIPYSAMRDGLTAGYATLSTEAGANCTACF
jgi:hypothetical protein